MVFATSAMSCYVEKSIKTITASSKKQLSNQHPKLDRFWSQFGSILGRVLGSKMGPSWTNSLQKSIFKSIKKVIAFRIALGMHCYRFWAPTWHPTGVTFVYKLEDFRSWGRFGPKLVAGPSKSRFHMILTPQEPISNDFGPQLGEFWASTWWILGTHPCVAVVTLAVFHFRHHSQCC